MSVDRSIEEKEEKTVINASAGLELRESSATEHSSAEASIDMMKVSVLKGEIQSGNYKMDESVLSDTAESMLNDAELSIGYLSAE